VKLIIKGIHEQVRKANGRNGVHIVPIFTHTCPTVVENNQLDNFLVSIIDLFSLIFWLITMLWWPKNAQERRCPKSFGSLHPECL